MTLLKAVLTRLAMAKEILSCFYKIQYQFILGFNVRWYENPRPKVPLGLGLKEWGEIPSPRRTGAEPP